MSGTLFALLVALVLLVVGVRASRSLVSRQVVGEAQAVGITVHAADVRDITFPPEIRRVFAEVVRARQEGLAALERARGETAALRSLANAARLMDDNPALLSLRVLQTLAGTGTGPTPTVVLGIPHGLFPLKTNGTTTEK